MALIQPAALALLAAAAIPLVLHLLVRRRGREVPFPTLRFLSPSPARRLSLGRLRDVALLSVRVSAIVILALLLAGLYRLGGAAFLQATGRLNRVVVVDLSGSMQAGGALGAARGAAGSALEVSPGDRVGIVAYHGEAWIVTALTADLEEAGEGLESLWEAEGPAGSSHGSALLQALRLLHGVPGRREVVWVSDYRAAGFAGLERRAAQAGVAWVSRPVAEATLANDAPAAVRVDRDGGAVVLRVWVDRFDEDGSWGREVSWSLDRLAEGRQVGQLPGGRGVEVRVERLAGTGWSVTVALAPSDAYPQDDVATFAVDLPAPVRVAVLGPEPDYVLGALQAAMHENGLQVSITDSPEEADLVVITDTDRASAAVRRQLDAARGRGARTVVALLRQGFGRRGFDGQAHSPGDRSAGPALRSLGEGGGHEMTVAFPLAGPPHGPGLEPWFPAWVESSVLDLFPAARPALSARSEAARRESALLAPGPPEAVSPAEQAWIAPRALAAETGLLRPLGVILLLLLLAEGGLAWQAGRRAS